VSVASGEVSVGAAAALGPDAAAEAILLVGWLWTGSRIGGGGRRTE
jgi:hypothetical protein